VCERPTAAVCECEIWAGHCVVFNYNNWAMGARVKKGQKTARPQPPTTENTQNVFRPCFFLFTFDGSAPT